MRLKFKNYELEPLANLLYDLELKGKDSRMRTRFIKVIATHLNDIVQKERADLIQEYATKNEDGSIKVVEGREHDVYIDPLREAEFYNEIEVLMAEELYIEESEGNKNMLLSVAETVLNGEIVVKGELASLYDMWCEEFEKVKDNYINM